MLPLADTAKQSRPAVVTALLIAANVAVFIWQAWLWFDHGKPALAGFVMEHALVPRRLVAHPGEGAAWLTVLSHMFMHGGIAHVLGNMWFLWLFGSGVEARLGPVRFLAVYLLAGVAAAALQFLVGPRSALPMLGASGAISGVLGAYLVLFPKAWVWTLVPWIVPIVPVPAVVFLVLWFALQTVNGLGALVTGVQGGVAWWAHAGGFIAGAAMVARAKRAGWLRRG